MWLNACGLGVSCLRLEGFRVQSLSAASDGRPLGFSENRGRYYSTLNSRILIIRTPK